MKKLICSFIAVFVLIFSPVTALAQSANVDEINTVDLLQGAYIVSADGTVKPVPAIDIGGGAELTPGDLLVCSSVYLSTTKNAVFNASCQYGDVAKLKVYRDSRKGGTTTSLGNFRATQGSWYGELKKSIPNGTWYFTVENGGSHNIMVDSVTINY